MAKTFLVGILPVLVVGILIFVPAGTLEYWEGWVFLSIFAFSTIGMTMVLRAKDSGLLERRAKVGPLSEKQLAQRVIQVFIFVMFAGILLVSSVDHRFAFSKTPGGLVIFGNLLVLLGFVIRFLVFRENSFASATIEVTRDQKVIETGLYSAVRHPMYLSVLIVLTGTPLALGSWLGLLFLIPLTLLIARRAIAEENFLHKNLPDYDGFMQKTRYRLLPFIW
jgi:protein-S-isoprenylcysteine O-methyltransferase Ste14